MTLPGPLSLANNSAELKALFTAGSVASTRDRVVLDGAESAGVLEFVELSPRFNLIVSQCHWNVDRQIIYRGEGWLRMNCCLEASAAMEFAGRGRFDLFGAECRLFHQPVGTDCTHFIRGQAGSLCVTISAKRDYFVEDLGLDPDELEGPFGDFLAGRSDDFFFERMAMRPYMHRTVLDMVRTSLAGRARALYLAAKAHELVCQSWDLALGNVSGDSAVLPARRQRERVEQARQILDASLDVTPAAGLLARKVGLNRNQLARGFRAAYGTSVYDYHLARRLDAAWDLLAQGDCTVAEVADKVGYRHQASFATAFRAHFGITPREVSSKREK